MKKQFIAIVLIFVMLSQICPVIYADTAALPPVPEVGRIIHEENFSDGTISSHWVIDSSGGSVTESDGVMNITRSENTGKTNAYYYLQENKADMQGLIGVEFTAMRDKPAKALNIRSYDSNDKEYYSGAIRNSKLHAVYSETAQTDGSSNALMEGSWTEFKINLLFDTANSTYSLWFNDECVVNNKYSHKAGVNSISYIRFYMETTHYQTLTLKSLKTYYVGDDSASSDGSSDSDGATSSDGSTSSDGNSTSSDGNAPELPPVPEVAHVICEEDFSDGKISPHWVIDSSGGSAVEENGVMKLTRSENEGTTSASYYLQEDKTPMQGLIGIEFNVKRDKPGRTLNIRSYDEDDNIYFLSAIRNGKLHVGYSESAQVDGSSNALKEGSWSEFKVNLLFDTENSAYSMWFNDECVVDNKYSYKAGISSLSYIRFYMEAAYYQTLTISNFKVYYAKAELTDEQAVNYDALSLNRSDLLTKAEQYGYVFDDLSLPTSGIYNTDITWTSSHPDIISSDGSLERPTDAYDYNPTVTLTATIRRGDATCNKSFDFNVLRIPENEEDIFELDYNWLTKEIITNENINEITENLNLPKQGLYGSAIVWSSSNSLVISSDGTVVRPDIGYDNPIVIITAGITSGNYSKEKTFIFTVLNKNYGKFPKPQLANLGTILDENFDDGILDEKIVFESFENGSVTETGGKLKITRGSLQSEEKGVYATCYFDDDTEGMGHTGVICVEYDITKSPVGKQLQMHLYSQRLQQEFTRCTWLNTGKFRNVSSITGNAYNDETIHLTFLIDTESQTFSWWVNDTLEGTSLPTHSADAVNVKAIKFYLTGGNALNSTVYIDNLKVYRTTLPEYIRLTNDIAAITSSNLLTAPENLLDANLIKDNLKLPTLGDYGSQISWSSSNPDIIASDGTVTRPAPGVYDENQRVILIATARLGDDYKTKSFVFTVINQSTDEDAVDMDFDTLTYSLISKETPDNTKMSLNLIPEGPYGSEIYWKSDNEKVITKSGRVIRPEAGCDNATVNLTAKVVKGNESREKVFNIVVQAEESFVEPEGYMTDEEFFGKWDASLGTWSIAGKLDYEEFSALKGVETAAKSGDYDKAKDELLSYMRNRTARNSLKMSNRNTNWANMTADMFGSKMKCYYMSEFTSGSEWGFSKMNLDTQWLSFGGMSSLILMARHNESSYTEIASIQNVNEEYHPKLTLVVNGETRVYEAVCDADMRAGDFIRQNTGGKTETFKVKSFGDLLGNENYRGIIKFDLSDIKESDKVTSAELSLYARTVPAAAGNKEIVVFYEPNTTWDEENINWKTIVGTVYGYSGIPGGPDWGGITGADVEYKYQLARFAWLIPLTLEWKLTNNDKYAKTAIWFIEDFLRDKGASINQYGDEGSRGQYPRSLDTSGRLDRWRMCIDALVDSEYMTAYTCTAILKHVWDATTSLVYFNKGAGNWYQSEMMSIIRSASMYPEFVDANAEEGLNWDVFARDSYENNLVLVNFHPDGAYIECSDDYSRGSMKGYVNYKASLLEDGIDVSDEYNEILKKGTLYNSLLLTPAGDSILYGDSEPETDTTQTYPEIVEWFGDHELEYVDTLGKKGTAPSWTSKLYPDKREAFLRSDWSRDALYLFTNAIGKGGHAHADDNHITAYAYGRTLLSDMGEFGYSSLNPYRQWGTSTVAHNTVEINETTQYGKAAYAGEKDPNGSGTIENFVTDQSYDFLSMTTYNNEGFTHQRNTMFTKPNYWIITDYIVPKDLSSVNSYKQLWHMLPGSDISIDSASGTIRSNFTDGANIIVQSVDSDASTKKELGWYDRAQLNLMEVDYGYFHKENTSGITTFNTVLVPYRGGSTATVNSEALDVSADASVATGMKINTVIDDEETTGYYYLSYEANPSVVRTFGAYKTDGQLAFVLENNTKGGYDAINLKNASFVKASDGTDIVSLGTRAESASVEWIGTELKLTAEGIDLTEIKILAAGNIKKFVVNGEEKEFSITNGYLTTNANTSENKIVNDASANKGGLIAGNQAGNENSPAPVPQGPAGSEGTSGGSTGSIGGGSVGTGSVGGSNVFYDLSGHWAHTDIMSLYNKGLVNGRGDGVFAPDDNITRAEFLTLVIRALGIGDGLYEGNFEDVVEIDWFAKNVGAALNLGLISDDTHFRPNDYITREEMTKIITQAYKLNKSLDVSGDIIPNFSDANAISRWAQEYVKSSVYLGIIKGFDDGSFRPQNNASRAEAAVCIIRLLSIL